MAGSAAAPPAHHKRRDSHMAQDAAAGVPPQPRCRRSVTRCAGGPSTCGPAGATARRRQGPVRDDGQTPGYRGNSRSSDGLRRPGPDGRHAIRKAEGVIVRLTCVGVFVVAVAAGLAQPRNPAPEAPPPQPQHVSSHRPTRWVAAPLAGRWSASSAPPGRATTISRATISIHGSPAAPAPPSRTSSSLSSTRGCRRA